MMDAANFSIVAPAQHAALVSISSSMLAHPYHARYELLEFATYTLAARAQQLVSMHAGCVGLNGCGVVLIGPSGTGKSTLALHCLSRGLRLLSEDSVFVSPRALSAYGNGAFLHLRTDNVCRPSDGRLDAIYACAATIRRRSGVEKLALDLRRSPELISPGPLDVAAFVFLSKARRSDRRLLQRIDAREVRERLERSQAYAAAQAGWREFLGRGKEVPAFILGRARLPETAARTIAALL
jgi:ABC-type cobalamin/Fe3+-siderophores transport system ATPase subunit